MAPENWGDGVRRNRLRYAVSFAAMASTLSSAWAFDLSFASDVAVGKAVFVVEMPLAAELLRSGLSREQVALALQLGMTDFAEHYCGVRIMSKGDRMVVDAKATQMGLAKDILEDAAKRLDERLSRHFRQEVADPGIPLTLCRQAREIQIGLEERDI